MKNFEIMKTCECLDGPYQNSPDLLFRKNSFIFFMFDYLLVDISFTSVVHHNAQKLALVGNECVFVGNNILIVAQSEQHPMLYAQGLLCGPIHWLLHEPPQLPLTCYAKIRYRQTEQPL